MKPYDAFGRVPSTVPPGQPVRYWHEALFYGVLTWTMCYALLLRLTSALAGSNPSDTFYAGLALPLWLLSLGKSFRQGLYETYLGAQSPILFVVFLGMSYILASGLALLVFVKALKPRTSTFHMSGLQLLEGEESIQEQRRISAKMASELLHIPITKDLVFDKKRLGEHILIAGGVGSGKTVLMTRMLHSFIRDKHPIRPKTFTYDVKGDYTARFPECVIISPYDERSACWDIAKDVRSASDAFLFAQSIIQESKDSKDNFFTSSAQNIVAGHIVTLQTIYGTNWGLSDLVNALDKPAGEQQALLSQFFPIGAQCIGDPDTPTSKSILQTVSTNSRVLRDMERAWGKYYLTKDGEPREHKGNLLERPKISLRDWMQDNYQGKEHIIVHGGNDPTLTRGYISALINCLAPHLISPAFPDNELGRCITFFLDELPSIGRINDFQGLVDKGRSKGIVVVAAFQELGQMREVYGDNLTGAMQSMMGTLFFGRMAPSEASQHIAKQFGTRSTANIKHGEKPEAFENGKSVIYPDKFGQLGFSKGKKGEWSIRMICTTGGSNPMVIDVPGRSYQNKRRSLIQSYWTRGAQKPLVENVELDCEKLEGALDGMDISATPKEEGKDKYLGAHRHDIDK